MDRTPLTSLEERVHEYVNKSVVPFERHGNILKGQGPQAALKFWSEQCVLVCPGPLIYLIRYGKCLNLFLKPQVVRRKYFYGQSSEHVQKLWQNVYINSVQSTEPIG